MEKVKQTQKPTTTDATVNITSVFPSVFTERATYRILELSETIAKMAQFQIDMQDEANAQMMTLSQTQGEYKNQLETHIKEDEDFQAEITKEIKEYKSEIKNEVKEMQKREYRKKPIIENYKAALLLAKDNLLGRLGHAHFCINACFEELNKYNCGISYVKELVSEMKGRCRRDARYHYGPNHDNYMFVFCCEVLEIYYGKEKLHKMLVEASIPI